jgi:hypothetical protein
MQPIQTINLTQFAASTSQRKAGVFDVEGDDFTAIKDAIDKAKTIRGEEIWNIAHDLANLVDKYDVEQVLIGVDAPWLIYPLTLTLKNRGVKAVFSYGVREYADMIMGTTLKTTPIVVHVDFVESEC